MRRTTMRLSYHLGAAPAMSAEMEDVRLKLTQHLLHSCACSRSVKPCSIRFLLSSGEAAPLRI
jgi:hypothetical protein